MCNYRMYELFEYSKFASRKYGYPEEWLIDKLDWLYQRIGNNIFNLLDNIGNLLASYKGKESIEEYFLTYLPKEAFQ